MEAVLIQTYNTKSNDCYKENKIEKIGDKTISK